MPQPTKWASVLRVLREKNLPFYFLFFFIFLWSLLKLETHLSTLCKCCWTLKKLIKTFELHCGKSIKAPLKRASNPPKERGKKRLLAPFSKDRY